MRSAARVGLLALASLLLWPSEGRAEWQIKPFLGVTFGGDTTFVDLDQVAGHPKIAFGVTNALLGEVIGVEADLGRVPGFFTGGHLVVNSSVTTLTGNVVLALPRHRTRYTLRPYVVGGAGLMHVHIDDFLAVLPVASSLAALDVGGGATGFLTDRIGVSWDVRYFRSIGGHDEGLAVSFGAEQLSFWRANMALVIRY